MTFRFSTQEGMQAFINENNMIANDQNLNIPLTSNNGLMLNSVNLNDPTEGSRSLIAELKLFDVALNDADRRKFGKINKNTICKNT